MTLDLEARRALAFETLTAKEYAAWDLREYHYRSHRAISLQLGISLGSVRDRLERANAKMSHAIDERFAAKVGAKPPPRKRRPDRYGIIAKMLLAQRDGGSLCYLCHQGFELDDLVIEHIIPRRAGGTDDPANLALACAPCNTEKAASFVSIVATSGRARYHRVD